MSFIAYYHFNNLYHSNDMTHTMDSLQQATSTIRRGNQPIFLDTLRLYFSQESGLNATYTLKMMKLCQHMYPCEDHILYK
jgi:hypothetical protein